VIAEEVMVQGEIKETKPKSMSQEIIHHQVQPTEITII
jgi:hypothetical protein